MSFALRFPPVERHALRCRSSDNRRRLRQLCLGGRVPQRTAATAKPPGPSRHFPRLRKREHVPSSDRGKPAPSRAFFGGYAETSLERSFPLGILMNRPVTESAAKKGEPR